MKIFVGNLSWNTTEDSLRDAFGHYGEIEFARVVTDRETGRSRGFGFVTYTNPEAAQNAISEMDNVELDGRNLRVSQAREREGFGGGGGGNRGGGGGGGGFRGNGGGRQRRDNW